MTSPTPRRCPHLPALLLLAGLAAAHAQQAAPPPETAPGGADRIEPLPAGLEDVGIDERLDTRLPLDLTFTDHDGRTVRLGDYFDGRRPVLLTLNYYKCPMLCGLMLNGLLDALRELEWTAGQQFQVVTLSFDPLETTPLARVKRNAYLSEYGRPAAAGGWHFLTGRKPAIDALLEAAGYRIRWDEKTQQWSHAAALILCTPDGRISRYLYGVLFEPRTLRLSLVEASEGRIGSTVDRILLFCYHYQDGEYTLAALNLVRAGGLLSLAAVGGLLGYLWRREARRRAAAAPGG